MHDLLTIFERLLANGYSPLPIGPRSADPRGPKGKSPARLAITGRGEPVWHHFKKWEIFCDRQPHSRAFSLDLKDPDCGLGIACGYRNLVAIDIDRDDLIDPVLAVLPPVMVAKRGRKGLTIFYRGDERWPKANYAGLLDFLAHGSQTVLPPTRHPDTGGRYEWTTARTLLDTPVDELPLFTANHRTAVEAVLAAHSWQAKPERSRAPPASPARSSWHSDDLAEHFAFNDGLNSAALANIQAWVDELTLPKGHWRGNVYRGVAPWRASGTGRDEAARGTNLSIAPSGIVDFGSGEKFTPVGVVMKALRLSWGDATDLLSERLGIEQPPPIVLRNGSKDDRLPLPTAEAAVRSAIEEFFADVPAAINLKRQYENDCSLASMGLGRYPLSAPVMPLAVVKVETGVGKTHALISALAGFGRRVAVFVPTHGLAEQAAADLQAKGVNAEIYRGYERPDPHSLKHSMCRNLPAYNAARDLGVGIRSTICERRVEGVLKRCPFAEECGAERQRLLAPSVWVFPSVMLTQPRPDFISDFDALVIDEAFIDKCISKPVTIELADLAGPVESSCYSAAERDALERGRRALVDACFGNGERDGWLSLNELKDRGLDADQAGYLALLERRRIDAGDLSRGIAPAALRNAVKRRGAANKLARTMADLWSEIEIFRLERHDYSGRIRVKHSKVTSEVTLTRLQPVHRDWDLPALLLDATPPPDLTLLDTAFGAPDGTATVAADVLAKWPQHVAVRQMLGATVSKSGLGLLPNQDVAPRNTRDLLRYIRMRAAAVAPARIGLITYKALLEKIGDDLPANVVYRHFGALAGMNDMRDVTGLVVIGRPAPPSTDVERAAGVWLGYPVAPTGFDRVRAKAGGRVVLVDRHRHPLVDALRWLVTDAGLLQAVGRLRPHRRSLPCWLEIINDVALDLPGLAATDWTKPGAVADMMAAGVILVNSRDARAVFERLSDWGARSVGGEVVLEYLLENPYRDSNTTSPTDPAAKPTRPFSYRKRGPGQKINRGWMLPAMLQGGARAVQGLLEAKLGTDLVSLEIDRARAIDTAYGRSILARAGRLIEEVGSEEDHGVENKD